MDETGADDRGDGLNAGPPSGNPSHTDPAGMGPADVEAPGVDPVEPDVDPLEDLAGEDEFYEFPEDDGEPHTALPTKVEAWRKRSATGAILTGFALGLQQVFEPNKQEPAVIMETSGEPPKDLPVEADFEYGRPKQSVVNVRPWLLPGASDAARAEEPATEEASPQTDGPSDTRDNGEHDA